MSRSRTASVKAALLGLSHPHAPGWLNTLLNLPEIGSVCLWDETEHPNAFDAVPRGGKIERFTADLDSLLAAGDIDFAIVCVRTDQAAGIGIKVMESGTHLLLEKPGGLNPKDIRRMIRTARRTRRKAGVMYVQRLQPAMREARKLIASGAIGRLLSIEVRLLTTQVRFRNPKLWFFHRRYAGGGILTWLGCHFLDLLQHVSGDPVASVSAQVATLSGEKIDVEDTAVLAFKCRSGALGTFISGYALAHSGGGFVNARGNDAYLAFNGHLGRIVWPYSNALELHIESPVKRGPAVRDKTFRLRKSTSYAGPVGEEFVRRFIAAIRGQGEIPVTLEEALSVSKIIEAAAKSAKTGRLATLSH